MEMTQPQAMSTVHTDTVALWSRHGVNLVCVYQRPVWYQSHHCPWTATVCSPQGLPTDPGPRSEVEVILQPGRSLPEETNLVSVPELWSFSFRMATALIVLE